MKYIVVDDEEAFVLYLERMIRQIEPQAEIACFTRALAAFDYLSANEVDVALLDIEMGGLSGLVLAEKCKELCKDINIIFVTGYSQYTMDALRMHVSGYLLKPVRADDLRTELNNLRHPRSLKSTHRVRLQTFGNFEVFVDNKPLHFPRTKCRECLAYLTDRKGAYIGAAEIAAVLWEDRAYDRAVQNNVHRVISDLMKTLNYVNAGNIIIKKRGELAVNINMVDCDYFRFLNGESHFLSSFRGEYMSNYSWAEFTLSELVKIKT